MDELIGIEVSGLEETQKKLRKIDDPQAQRNASKDVAVYLRKELQKYPSPKHITRKQAFGQTFQTAKQRRWFFAALGSGELILPYKRSGDLRKNWKIHQFGHTDHLVINETPGAQYVQSRDTQSRMMKLIGWKTVEDVIEKGKHKIRDIVNKTYYAWLRKVGLK